MDGNSGRRISNGDIPCAYRSGRRDAIPFTVGITVGIAIGVAFHHADPEAVSDTGTGEAAPGNRAPYGEGDGQLHGGIVECRAEGGIL